MTKTTILALLSILPLWGACTAEAGGGGATQPPADKTANQPAQPPAEEPAVTVTMENIEVTAAAALLADGEEIVVLDIRTPGEYAKGHIPGAINIDFTADAFAEELAKLDRNQRYLMHCQSGGRSTRSLPQFKELGFVTVYHLDSGMRGWIEAKQPIEK